jgi:hypothetical protein
MNTMVMVPRNIRVFSDTETDLDLTSGRVYPITERQMRSGSIRAALMDGRLRAVAGEIQFPFKDSVIVIKGIEGGNTYIEWNTPNSKWKKDFQTNEVKRTDIHAPSFKEVMVQNIKPKRGRPRKK